MEEKPTSAPPPPRFATLPLELSGFNNNGSSATTNGTPAVAYTRLDRPANGIAGTFALSFPGGARTETSQLPFDASARK